MSEEARKQERSHCTRQTFCILGIIMILLSGANAFSRGLVWRISSQRLGSSSRLLSTTTTTSTGTRTNDAVLLKHTDFSSSAATLTKTTPALFLHGLLGNKRNFASIARSLSQQLEKPRQILGLDLRNHGDNHHDWRDSMSYMDMAADVLHFCDSQNIDKVELIGHSVGGKVAQAVALLEPDRVDGLVVIDIAPVQYTEDEPHWKAVKDIIDTLMTMNLQPGMSKRDADQQLQHAIPDAALRAFCLTNVDLAAGEWKINLDAIASQLDALATFDVEPSSLSSPSFQYTGDAFFIHGGQSRFVRHQHLETIGKFFPNHMLTTIRGAGHWVHAEAPEDTTALLKRFLDR